MSTIERQVFDFLGYMWAPIIGNFLQTIFVIIGLFGTYQYRPKVVVVYAVWCLLWIGWNVFVICLYLEVGMLSRKSPILNLCTGNRSWWFSNGIGCNASSIDESKDYVQGCLLQYYYVEVIHAGAQCLLSLIGFIAACSVIYIYTEEDDSSQPVSDELEYIKMRYKSPARSSFREGRAYESLPHGTPTSTNTMETPTPTPIPKTQPEVTATTEPARPTNQNRPPQQQQRERRPSKGSRRSSKSNGKNHRKSNGQPNTAERAELPREQLPWVHIAPSQHQRQDSSNSTPPQTLQTRIPNYTQEEPPQDIRQQQGLPDLPGNYMPDRRSPPPLPDLPDLPREYLRPEPPISDLYSRPQRRPQPPPRNAELYNRANRRPVEPPQIQVPTTRAPMPQPSPPPPPPTQQPYHRHMSQPRPPPPAPPQVPPQLPPQIPPSSPQQHQQSPTEGLYSQPWDLRRIPGIHYMPRTDSDPPPSYRSASPPSEEGPAPYIQFLSDRHEISDNTFV